jgi:hypothetical protein
MLMGAPVIRRRYRLLMLPAGSRKDRSSLARTCGEYFWERPELCRSD